METIVVIVGFLGAGKTTLLKHLVEVFSEAAWSPFVILNDYANANLDSEQLSDETKPDWVRALTGSCICCDGIGELRESVNAIPKREKGITFIEANGTSDACRLMGFLGVGLQARFKPPIQVSVVDVKNWQKRGEHNKLEANQIQVSSLVLLSHVDKVSQQRIADVSKEIQALNPLASIVSTKELNALLLPSLAPSKNSAEDLDHQQAHWASCSIDLPELSHLRRVQEICDAIPSSVLRVKGCTRIAQEENYTYFERCPDGEIYVRPYRGKPVTGMKLLAVGPGSNPAMLLRAVS